MLNGNPTPQLAVAYVIYLIQGRFPRREAIALLGGTLGGSVPVSLSACGPLEGRTCTMSAYMALALSCQQCRVQKSMVLDVKSPHPFLYLFLSGTDIPINASRRYHVIPTAIQTPAMFDRSLAVGETTKKLRPCPPHLESGKWFAGLPAGSCELQLLLGIRSPLLQAISAVLARTTRQRRRTRYQ